MGGRFVTPTSIEFFGGNGVTNKMMQTDQEFGPNSAGARE